MYDFKSARRRIEDLKFMYRRNKKHHEKDGTWDWIIVGEIEELEKELEEAHKNRTAVRQDDRSDLNIITLTIPQ